MNYLSVCSGIEAASCAWHPLGWTPVAFSEVDPFPAAVLAHRFPNVPNRGDMTKFKDWPDADVDVLVGGTPCQSFSVAGLRKGLDDPRGNLMLTYLAIAARYRPRWLVWENVPGVLSSNGGRDFGTLLGGLGQLGYGFAYRVLDAQFVRVESHPGAVPQRRRRVFVVGCAGDWRGAAAVLLERESMLGHPAPRRETGQGTAGSAGDGVARCLTTGEAKRQDWETCNFVAHSLTAGGFDASEDGTGRGTPLVPVGVTIHGTDPTVQRIASYADVAQCLRARAPGNIDNSSTTVVQQPMAFDTTQLTSAANRSNPRPGDPCHPLAAGAHPPAIAFAHQAGGTQTTLGYDPEARTSPTLAKSQTVAAVQGMQVRRLTPLECERLQGFPDGWTDVPYRGKPAADGPRYKALGNSMAVNCMAWLGQRIDMVDNLSEAA